MRHGAEQAQRPLALMSNKQETEMLRRILFAAGVSYLFRKLSGRRSGRRISRY
jgi:hypothetical protein